MIEIMKMTYIEVIMMTKKRMTCANCGFVFDYCDDYEILQPICPKCSSNACDDPKGNWTIGK